MWKAVQRIILAVIWTPVCTLIQPFVHKNVCSAFRSHACSYGCSCGCSYNCSQFFFCSSLSSSATKQYICYAIRLYSNMTAGQKFWGGGNYGWKYSNNCCYRNSTNEKDEITASDIMKQPSKNDFSICMYKYMYIIVLQHSCFATKQYIYIIVRQ